MHEVDFVFGRKGLRFFRAQGAKVRNTEGACGHNARNSLKTLRTDIVDWNYLAVDT